jgi:hypothetical protein
LTYVFHYYDLDYLNSKELTFDEQSIFSMDDAELLAANILLKVWKLQSLEAELSGISPVVPGEELLFCLTSGRR